MLIVFFSESYLYRLVVHCQQGAHIVMLYNSVSDTLQVLNPVVYYWFRILHMFVQSSTELCTIDKSHACTSLCYSPHISALLVC